MPKIARRISHILLSLARARLQNHFDAPVLWARLIPAIKNSIQMMMKFHLFNIKCKFGNESARRLSRAHRMEYKAMKCELAREGGSISHSDEYE